MSDWPALLFLLGLALFTLKHVGALKRVSYLQGPRPLFSPLHPLGVLIPTCSWNPGMDGFWRDRRTAFFNFRHDVVALVPILFGRPLCFTSSADVMRQVLANETRYEIPKPQELTLTSLWGTSIVYSTGELWKRYRRAIAPSFNPSTYSLVWREALSTYQALLENQGWDCKDEVIIPEINSVIIKFTFVIFATCGFGLPMVWPKSREGSGQTMSISTALNIASETLIPRLFIPRWAYYLPIRRLKEIDTAWRVARAFIHDCIQARQDDATGGSDERLDLLSRLVSSSQGGGKYKLSDDEVVGNMFSLLFAGHETTASVLSGTLGYLALYQEEQEKAYKEILSVVPADREPEFSDMHKLVHVFACFQEASRIYPAAFIMGREITADIPVTVKRPREQTLVFKKGTTFIADLIAIHHNPNDFPEPDRYIPSRWYDVQDADISMFGSGTHSCIGRKFAQAEAVAFLSVLLRDWKLDIVLAPGESRSQYEERIMGKAGLASTAFSVGKVPLKLTRRYKSP
ncbi:cytochrome P450 [Infundibulicybe gibba]|nr:cytochrome P450 [Infundibulicybe gibba]